MIKLDWVGQDVVEPAFGEVGGHAGRLRMSKQTLGRHDDQRSPEIASKLTTQQVEVLGWCGGLDHLHVVARAQRQEPFHASGGVFGPLPFVAMGQHQDQA